MTLVRNQIGDMFGGETGKFTCRKNKVKMQDFEEKNAACYWYNVRVRTASLLVQCEGADCKVIGTM